MSQTGKNRRTLANMTGMSVSEQKEWEAEERKRRRQAKLFERSDVAKVADSLLEYIQDNMDKIEDPLGMQQVANAIVTVGRFRVEIDGPQEDEDGNTNEEMDLKAEQARQKLQVVDGHRA